jgi:signal transduction histidine kinase/ABC-type amino acid transport substrate-binding protein
MQVNHFLRYLNLKNFLFAFTVYFILCCNLLALESDESINQNFSTKKRVVFGCDDNFPPFVYIDENGEPNGYYIDLINEIGRVNNWKIEVRLSQWDNIVRGILVDKNIDFTALAYQKRRENIFLFSTPHLVETSEIYVRNSTKNIGELNDLIGKEIIVMRNATTHMNLEDQAFDATYILVDGDPDALILLSQGLHDAAIVARYAGLSAIERYRLNNLITVGKPLFPRDYVLATALDRDELMSEINSGLKVLQSDGTYSKLNRKWFGSAQEKIHSISRYLYYAASVLLLLIGLAAASFVWNWSLKRKVNQKTSELNSELVERKQAEKSLMESESKFKRLYVEFKTILDSIPGVLALFDKNLKIVWSNKHDWRNAKDKDIDYFQIEADRIAGILKFQSYQSQLHMCLKRGIQVEYISADCHGKNWEIRCFPMKDSNGGISHILVLANDVTETMQLREEAIAASRLASLGELSAGIAHEINNPTGLILLYMPLLQDFFKDMVAIFDRELGQQTTMRVGGLPYEKARSEIDMSINAIGDGAKRIKRIVDDLKNFSRHDVLDSNENVDVNSSIQTAIRLSGNLIKQSTKHLICEYADQTLYVSGNLQRIEQVILNLVQNACYALSNMDERIIVRAFLASRGDKVCIEIEDEGCGMEPEVLNKITDPFFTTRREKGGTGLGLSISARIINEHGGKLEFKSRPGKGTLARVTLPAGKRS